MSRQEFLFYFCRQSDEVMTCCWTACFSLCLSVSLSVSLSFCLSLPLSVSLCLFLCLSLSLSVSLCLSSLSIYLSLSLVLSLSLSLCLRKRTEDFKDSEDLMAEFISKKQPSISPVCHCAISRNWTESENFKVIDTKLIKHQSDPLGKHHIRTQTALNVFFFFLRCFKAEWGASSFSNTLSGYEDQKDSPWNKHW